jgi:O-antigen ligase
MGTAIKETIQIVEFIVLIHLVASATRDEERRRQFFRILLIGLGGLSVFAAAWHIAHGSFANYKDLGDPKYAFALFALLASVSYLRNRTSMRWIVLIGAVLLAILSGERKGWVALAGAGTIMYFLFQGRSVWGFVSSFFRPRLLFGGGVVAVLMVVAALQFEYVRIQVQSMYDLYVIASNVSLQMDLSAFETSGSNLARLYILLFTVRTALAHPIFGVGTGGWYDALASASEESVSSSYLIGAHSEYQRLTVENGLLGLGLYVITWFVTLRTAVRFFRQAPTHLRMSILSLVGLIVFGALINLFLGGGALNIVFLALPVGLLLGLENDSALKETRQEALTTPQTAGT